MKKINFKYILYAFLFVISVNAIFASNFKSILDKNNFKFFSMASEKEKKFYFDNGKLKSKQFYIGNKKSGTWEFYYESGKLKSTITFDFYSPYEEAFVKNYDENGIIISTGKILNSEMISAWKYYDEHGKLNHLFNYTSGEIVVFNEDEKPILKLNEKEFIEELKNVQEEIKDDRVKSSEN
ncbi:toxin-antitoxin system YwqK family antitoxin [Fusobacterium gastrosuis]|uniref:toxin-antitoxin system YwqK family antitoxin n=1 Tax=Fusobacterium gastrosuis TaxID=1755100 RepID=UPI002A9E04B9|nr:toxin-antitoxin system YwqK family antitoxin [Fusobacterium gastrosuis]